MATLKSTNPSNGNLLGEVDISSEKEINEKIAKARKAQESWNKLGISGRNEYLRKVVENFLEHKEELAQISSKEMGMPITMSRSDVDDSMHYFSWYIDNAKEYLKLLKRGKLTPEIFVTLNDRDKWLKLIWCTSAILIIFIILLV